MLGITTHMEEMIEANGPSMMMQKYAWWTAPRTKTHIFSSTSVSKLMIFNNLKMLRRSFANFLK